MGKIPRWLRIVLILFVVLVVVALVAPYFLDVDRYRSTIIAAIEKETGRKAEIGKIRARLIPAIGFTIENFRLGNPPGFAEGNLLEVEAIRGTLAWLPLLRREFQLSSIELVRPKVVLLEDERGRSNYDFGKEDKQRQAQTASAFRIADIDSIDLTEVDVTLGAVAGRKRAVVPTLRASNISAELSNVALDTKRLKQWEAEADLKGVQLQLAALRHPVEFTSGNFTLDEGKITSEFEADLAKAADVKGSLRVNDVEKALVEFEFSTPLLDLDKLTAAAADTPKAATPPARGPSELLAKGKVSARRLRWAPYEGTNVAADMRIFTDRVEISPVSMAFYGGTVGASARIDRRQSPERFSANLDVKNLDVAQVTAASGAQQKVTGTGELTLQAFGSLGGNVLHSLTGNGNLAVRDGTLPGFDLGAMRTLAKVQKVLTFGAGSAEQFSGATRFNSITADLSITGARVHSQRIHLDSPSGTVDMRGSMGFDQTLSYDGNAVLMGGQAGTGTKDPIGAITGVLGTVTKQTVGRISVPFAVRGTLEDPKIHPGRGIPGFSTAPASTQTAETQTEEQPKKKKSIFDIFKKP